MSKRRKCVLIIVAALLIAGVWTWRYVSLNSFYRSLYQEVRYTYSAGEITSLEANDMDGGYSIRVDGFAIMDIPQLCSTFSLSENDVTTTADKIAVVYATLYNANSQLPGVNLIDFNLHGIDNYATVDWELVPLINPVLKDTGNYGISLSPGTEYSIVIPFDLFEQYFGADTWKNLDSYPFYLCRSTTDGEIDVECPEPSLYLDY